MISNYYTLKYLAETAAPVIVGNTLTGMFTQEKDELIISFRPPCPALVISCRPTASTCYLHGGIARARRNSTDIMTESREVRLTGLTIAPGDRVIHLELEDGRVIAAQFFGPKSNVLLVQDGSIVSAFKHAKELTGSKYKTSTEEIIFDFAQFRQALQEDPSALASSLLRKSFPLLGATLTREALFRAGLPFASPAAHVTDEARLAVEQAIRSILTELQHPRARVYEKDGEPEAFSLVPLHHAAALVERDFENIHEAVRYFLARRRAVAQVSDRKSQLTATIRQRIEKARRTEAAISEEAAESARADGYERAGSLLMANLSLLQKGDRSITLDGEKIALDPKLPPVHNAQRYFERAKRSRLAAQQAVARLTRLRDEIVLGERLLSTLEDVTTNEEVKQFMQDRANELDQFGIGEKSERQSQLPFRIFTVEGGFEVWAGKSSANNDLLTLHHAKPNDLWFHARGSSGSHVLLKVGSGKGEPGKKAKEQAAGIAAYYSKMKNAKMVPVAMTEKKYVRKPKGAPPGTVVLEREKVIFAEPGLPENPPTSPGPFSLPSKKGREKGVG
jgi:predicted ribosome quality control (RQC) complex YloA/Tae2 family protein